MDSSQIKSLDIYTKNKVNTEITYFTKQNSSSYCGSAICYNTQENEILAFSIPKRSLEDDSYLEVLLKESAERIQKINQIASRGNYRSFLTLTKKTNSTLNLKELFHNIIKSYHDKFSIKRIQQIYKCNIPKAEEIKQNNIKKYLHLNVLEWFEREIKELALFNIATKKRINFKDIKKKGKKYFKIYKENFKKKHSKEINTEFDKIKKSQLRKKLLNKEDYDYKYQVEKLRFHHSLSYEVSYSQVEYTKNKEQHTHTLTSYYIPNSLIKEEYIKVGNTQPIFDNKFIFDSFINNYSNSQYFEKLQRTNSRGKKEINLTKAYEKIDSMFNKNILTWFDLSKDIINYISKYMGKDSIDTYKIRKQLDDKSNIYTFRGNKYNPDIFEKQQSNYSQLGEGFISKSLNSSSVRITNVSEQQKQNYVDILQEGRFFDKNINTKYIEIYKHIHSSIKNLKKINYENLETIEILQENNLDKQDLFKQCESKLISSYCMQYIKQKEQITIDSQDFIEILSSNLNEEKKDILPKILNSPLSCLGGLAGTGKTHLILQLSKLKQYDVVYLVKTNSQKKSLQEKSKKMNLNINVFTIAKYLDMKYNSYYINAMNCRETIDKPIFLIIDEIGQVSSTELKAIFEGIELNSIGKVLFSGDIHQQKNYTSNSLLNDFKHLEYIDNFNLKQIMRQKEGSQAQEIVNNYKTKNEIYVNDYIDFYKELDKTKHLVNSLLKKNYLIITNSIKLKKHISQMIQNEFKTFLIINKTFISSSRIKFTNGSKYNLLKETTTQTKIEDLETKQVYSVNKYEYESYFSSALCNNIDKIQGLGFDKCVIFFDNYSNKLLTQEKYYTSISRSKEEIKVYFQNKRTLEQLEDNFEQNNDLFMFQHPEKILSTIDSYLDRNLSPPAEI